MGAIFMPTMDLILHMKRVPHVVTIHDAEKHMREALVRYETLFDKLDELRTAYLLLHPWMLLK